MSARTDSRGTRIVYVVLAIVVLIPWPLIAWGRAQRSASAPAVLEEVWPQPGGRFAIGTYSFTVAGEVYRDRDVPGRIAGRGNRVWTAEELVGMQVCYDPERPGEDFALTPARYRCGDPDFITTDGGW